MLAPTDELIATEEKKLAFSPLEKDEILKHWRRRGPNGLTYGITEYEVHQWDALERAHGLEGLFVCNEEGLGLAYMRGLPVPTLPFHALWSDKGRVASIVDKQGTPLLPVHGLQAKRLLAYLVVEHQTKAVGICTHPDLANTLWPPSCQDLPRTRILDVLMCTINQCIKPKCIENIRGRGYRLLGA